MAAHLLVYISSAGVSTALWRRGLTDCRRFPPGPEGEAAFAALLAGLRRVPVAFAVDVVEEDYRLETLPHTRGQDRAELLGRRLRQTYRSTPYVSAVLLGRETEQRRDDRYLFMALTEVGGVEPWVKAVMERGLPVEGIFPVPAVMASGTRALALATGPTLVVSRHTAGLRQTFLDQGRFRFSRLTPLRGAADEESDAALAAEILNTRLYLNALQAARADTVVEVVLADQDGSLRGLEGRLAESGNLRVRHVDQARLVASGVAATALAATPDALPLHLLGLGAPAANLAPGELTGSFRVHRAARAVLAVAGAAASLAVLWVVADLERLRSLENEIDAAERETRRLEQEYASLTREFPQSRVSAAVLRQTVDAYERLRAQGRSPEDLFGILSQALEASPSVTLVGLSWRHGRFDDAGAAFGSAKDAARDVGPLRQAGMMTGEIQPFTGDYRSAVAAIREFAATLRRHPRVAEVRILKLPLDDSSRQSLSGSTTTQAEAREGARFDLSVLLREGGT